MLDRSIHECLEACITEARALTSSTFALRSRLVTVVTLVAATTTESTSCTTVEALAATDPVGLAFFELFFIVFVHLKSASCSTSARDALADRASLEKAAPHVIEVLGHRKKITSRRDSRNCGIAALSTNAIYTHHLA